MSLGRPKIGPFNRPARSAYSSGVSMGPPERTGRGENRARERVRSYITIAPAIATFTQNRVGIFTTNLHRDSMSSDSDPFSGPST